MNQISGNSNLYILNIGPNYKPNLFITKELELCYSNELEKWKFVAFLTTLFTDKYRIVIPNKIRSLLWNQIRRYYISQDK